MMLWRLELCNAGAWWAARQWQAGRQGAGLVAALGCSTPVAPAAEAGYRGPPGPTRAGCLTPPRPHSTLHPAAATDRVLTLAAAAPAERISAAACGATDHMPREEALQMLEETCSGGWPGSAWLGCAVCLPACALWWGAGAAFRPGVRYVRLQHTTPLHLCPPTPCLAAQPGTPFARTCTRTGWSGGACWGARCCGA